jgi:two-component system, NarL family, sensor histidine kinase UhpB
MSQSSGTPRSTQLSLARDVTVVAAVTLGTALLAAHFELNEVVFSMTRRWEHVQLDESPIALLVLAIGLMWIAWRRYRQALVELQARQLAEQNLAAALRENRELGHQHLRMLEAERKHLARELHDELGQYLNAIKLDAVAIADVASDERSGYRQAGQRIVQAVDHVHGVVSDMIRRLRPVGLDELGLAAAIEGCLDQWRQRLPETRFTLRAGAGLEGLDELANLTIYRLIQEGLTNSSRHAQARRIDVTVERCESPDGGHGEIVLTLSDDGCGMDTRARRSGFGLGSMRERVEMMGGRFAIHSSPGHGFSLEARIPATDTRT